MRIDLYGTFRTSSHLSQYALVIMVILLWLMVGMMFPASCKDAKPTCDLGNDDHGEHLAQVLLILPSF